MDCYGSLTADRHKHRLIVKKKILIGATLTCTRGVEGINVPILPLPSAQEHLEEKTDDVC